MSIIIYLTALLLLFTLVQPLNILPARRTEDLTEHRKPIIDALVNYLLNTRRSEIDSKALAKTKVLLKTLSKKRASGKKPLRNSVGIPTEIPTRQADLIEMELKDSLASKHSALLDRPFIEKKGRNDFLVIRPDVVDPYVTIIPNAIYYNIEKKCVNWLDDCSINGIRARLLKGIHSPYK